jgi:hypothetical protein
VQERPAERDQDQAASNSDNGESDAEEYEEMRTNQHGPCKKQNAVDRNTTAKRVALAFRA